MITLENLETSFQLAHRKVLPSGKLLVREDENLDEIFLIISGGVKVYTLSEEGKEITLSIRGKGEIVGLYSFLLNDTTKANVETIEETEILIIQKSKVKDLIKESPEFLLELLQYTAFESRQKNKYLKRVFSDNLELKTLKTLKRIAKLSPDRKVHLSQEDLSLIIGATRPRITEALNKLVTKKRILISKKEITLLNSGTK